MEWWPSHKESVALTILQSLLVILVLAFCHYSGRFVSYQSHVKKCTALSSEYRSKIKDLEDCIESLKEEISSNPTLINAAIDSKLEQENKILIQDKIILAQANVFLKKQIDDLQKENVERQIRKENRMKMMLSLDRLSASISV